MDKGLICGNLLDYGSQGLNSSDRNTAGIITIMNSEMRLISRQEVPHRGITAPQGSVVTVRHINHCRLRLEELEPTDIQQRDSFGSNSWCLAETKSYLETESRV
ncbi:hypothetical protein AAFF_G00332940 [Aldrovandia affinis]|uniref:Uncharacterized protein n=1 Tax=Aldrovandia affinis TaxID=143900 RepID=A0AAD7WPW2_9TELE|nr:hypothetical protein AAFF_G00332940 [Aldrovandia affinis]